MKELFDWFTQIISPLLKNYLDKQTFINSSPKYSQFSFQNNRKRFPIVLPSAFQVCMGCIVYYARLLSYFLFRQVLTNFTFFFFKSLLLTSFHVFLVWHIGKLTLTLQVLHYQIKHSLPSFPNDHTIAVFYPANISLCYSILVQSSLYLQKFYPQT